MRSKKWFEIDRGAVSVSVNYPTLFIVGQNVEAGRLVKLTVDPITRVSTFDNWYSDEYPSRCYGLCFDVDNSIVYFESLRHHKIPVELFIYPKGGHGFVLFQPVEEWITPIMKWLKNPKLISK